MKKHSILVSSVLCLLALVGLESQGWAQQVTEVAPGVFFRTTDKGCNNGWVVMEDYVLVIDSNFPDEAEAVVQDIRKTTDKPIRLLLNTHVHGDHVLGNGVFSAEGAVITAQQNTREAWPLLREEYKSWISRNPRFQDSSFVEPSQYFDTHLVIEDSQRRVEFLYYGHAHTRGDVVVYLPNEKILFTGDVCVNGAYNYLGQCYLTSWIDVLDALAELDIQTVCPGHGPSAGKDLLNTQARYLEALQDQVQSAIDEGKPLEEILTTIHIPFYKEWTGVEPPKANIELVYHFLTGFHMSPELIDLGLKAGPSPTKETPGWTSPKKLVTLRYSPSLVQNLERIAPGLRIVNVRNEAELEKEIQDADGCLAFVKPSILRTAPQLRWIHSYSAGVENFMYPELIAHSLVLTNGQAKSGPSISDTVMGYMLMFSRGLGAQYKEQLQGRWTRLDRIPRFVLEGKTLLILGLGGIGSQIAEKADGLGMKIYAIDPAPVTRPPYVRRVVPPQEIEQYLPKADFVVSTVPLTRQTERYFGKSYFELMKPSAYFINVGRGRTVHQDDLTAALQNKAIAGAALDVTDPEPLPEEHPLWTMDNVIITPHVSGWSTEGSDLAWGLVRENVRRFATGEPLLNVVDKSKGY
ncbi:MAG: NAD(P)-dependent oxidoreductase [bacterium]|jgi:phosphoglycerate dehydrogenase-like enzyme/glyoxylase-like metal-dependent hydrolase (beta-lactamase superfamily II)|nr:NAD(P)-dependent oxidoreductase [bacterium]